ncbi:hypothetical membrane protein [Pseudarthrobacter enclensis]|nr:DUF998 domain-containing protein [Pseudarthrobacter enclensis]SCC01299.1 hypothetical membrane protein [Pseudarthrobacter enclensis]
MSSRRRMGATLWVLCLLTFPAQLLAAAQWPEPYSWQGNLISDLGVTGCGIYDAGTRVERYICSPAHLLANGATVANGLLLAAGAVLLWSSWPRPRTGKVAMAFLALGGLLVAVVGVLPWDVEPDGHNAAALAQAVVQWAGMLILAVTLRGSTAGRWAGALTMACVVLSAVGFVLFVGAVGGGPSAPLGLGLTERLAFDTLTVWGAALGLMVLAMPGALRGGSGPFHGKPQLAAR